ncbi:PilZ domain-containing protein [Mariprofundus erugo]|uniref:PilZ domain-containing protein n=1 Tax=Mariprofundus erugo TaxID=2528639 RepID=A0A5R9GHQ9_9PROT|nr:PilZ domain-containing protein [Mariprofundus erugo]TLS66301.1 PilZ domain-containing protein [Mariprofundus erugo]
MSEQTERLLEEHIARDLPMLRKEDRRDIIQLIAGHQPALNADRLADSMIASGVEVGVLLAVLLRYEWMVVQGIMKSTAAGGIAGQLPAFSRCVERFGTLQTAVLNAVERNWKKRLDKEVAARVVAECHAEWVREGVVRIHNYFQEMPVTANAGFHGYAGEYLTIMASPEVGRVFTCTDDMQEALITSPDQAFKIRVGVIRCRKGLLTLAVRDVAPAMQETREHFRVRMTEEIEVKLRRQSGMVVGRLIDISVSGMKVAMAAPCDLARDERLRCNWLLAGSACEADMTVCWRKERGDMLQFGLKFTRLGAVHEQVHKLMLIQQQRLIDRLKHLGAPSWMEMA